MASGTGFRLLSLLEGLGGAALVAVVLADVFRTVVLPRASGRALRLGPPLRRLALRGWLTLAPLRRPDARHATLGLLGPLLIVAELVVWVVLLVVGYGLLLHALGDGMKPEPGLVDALFAAGSMFMTLGLSSPQEAVSGPVRLVMVLAAGSGLTVVTLVVTFLLSVQEALHRRESLVLRLRVRTGPHPSGAALLDTHMRLAAEHDAAMREFFASWEEWSADVLLTHRAFPVLAYFRSHDEDCEWLAALGAVLDACAVVVATRHDGSAEHAALCHAMGARFVRELAEQFSLEYADGPDMARDTFEDALRRLGDGFGTEGAWERFAPLRAEHHPPLAALMRRFGVAPEGW